MRSLRRPLALLAAVVGSIVLQTTLFGRLNVDGIAPDVVLLTLVLASLRLRTDRALLVAFAAGIVFDALTATAIGLRAFTYTAIVYVARRTHERADFSPAATAVWAAVMTFFGVVLLRCSPSVRSSGSSTSTEGRRSVGCSSSRCST